MDIPYVYGNRRISACRVTVTFSHTAMPTRIIRRNRDNFTACDVNKFKMVIFYRHKVRKKLHEINHLESRLENTRIKEYNVLFGRRH